MGCIIHFDGGLCPASTVYHVDGTDAYIYEVPRHAYEEETKKINLYKAGKECKSHAKTINKSSLKSLTAEQLDSLYYICAHGKDCDKPRFFLGIVNEADSRLPYELVGLDAEAVAKAKKHAKLVL